jgi:hypothetical protein
MGIFTQEVIMTAEDFAEAVDALITAAREGALSDEKMITVLEHAVEALDERLSRRPLFTQLSPQRSTAHQKFPSLDPPLLRAQQHRAGPQRVGEDS